MRPKSRPWRLVGVTAAVGLLALGDAALGHDHADGSALGLCNRPDANITHFFAFTVGKDHPQKPDTLVLAVATFSQLRCFNPPAIPVPEWYSEDVSFDFHVDLDADIVRTGTTKHPVGDPITDYDRMMRFGGTIVDPYWIYEDVTFTVGFEATPVGTTAPKLTLDGLPPGAEDKIRVFPDPRDPDPSLHSARRRVSEGSPVVTAVVLEVPLALLSEKGPGHQGDGGSHEMLFWVNAKLDDVIVDSVGFPNTSNQPGNLQLNWHHPRDQAPYFLSPQTIGEFPRADVLILDSAYEPRFPQGLFIPFDPSNPETFPNGHPLVVMTTDANGRPIFPYLLPPRQYGMTGPLS